MTATTPASASAAPINPPAKLGDYYRNPRPETIPTVCLPDLHLAANSAQLAQHYAQVGNAAACRRKLVLGLEAINRAIAGGAV